MDYYINLLSSTNTDGKSVNPKIIGLGPVLDEEQQALLYVNFTTEEVKKALFGINSDKSPGMDGFEASFISVHGILWEKIYIGS